MPGVKSRCCNSASSSRAGKLRISCVVIMSTRIAISTAPKVIGSRLSTPCTVDVTSHKEMFSRKPNAEWISDHRKITDSRATSIRIERTSRRDWVLIASRSSSTSSASEVPSVLLTWFGSSSPRAR